MQRDGGPHDHYPYSDSIGCPICEAPGIVPPSTGFRLRPIHDEVGFNYVAALRRIKTRLTFEAIAYATGYESNGGVSRIFAGAIPSHKQGEAIWALYVELFGERPPLSSAVADAPVTT